MEYVTLDPHQSDALAHAAGFIQARDVDGRVVGYFVPKLPPDPVENLEELLRRKSSKLPCYTMAQVKEHLRSLETR